MNTYFADKVSFFVKPDGTTHIRFTHVADDATEADFTVCTIVLPTELALEVSKMIAKGILEFKQLTEKSSKKSNN